MNGSYVALASPAYALLIALELLFSYRAFRRGRRPLGFSFADALTNLSCGIGSQALVAITVLQGVLCYGWVVDHGRLLPLWPNRPWAWALGIVLVDLCWYAYHRASHRVALLWTTHAVHHQSEHFNLTVSLRLSWFSGLFSWIFHLPLAVLGMPLAMHVALRTAHSFYQFLLHTRHVGRLGPLEWLLNTPSHHRVHHGIEAGYRDHNFGGIFIVWDRLFRTFQPERDEPIYGSAPPLRSLNPVWANLVEWARLAGQLRATPGVLPRLRLCLMPPGWRPPGAAALPDAATPEAGAPRAGAPHRESARWAQLRQEPGLPPPALLGYLCLHFLLLLLFSTYFMLRADHLAPLPFWLALGQMILPMVVWSALLEGRGYGIWIEGLRLLSLGLLSAFALRGAPALGPVPAAGIALLFLTGSLAWLSRLCPAPPPQPWRPRTAAEARQHRALGALILLALAFYAVYKQRIGMLGDLLYGCHVAAAAIAVGLLWHLRPVVSAGLVFVSGIGVPMWLVLVISTRTTNALSVVLHTLPPVAAALYARQQGLDRRAWLPAWLTFLALLPPSYFFTDPALNVNLTHRPSPELAYFVPGTWDARVYGCVMALALLHAAHFALSRVVRDNSPGAARPVV